MVLDFSAPWLYVRFSDHPLRVAHTVSLQFSLLVLDFVSSQPLDPFPCKLFLFID